MACSTLFVRAKAVRGLVFRVMLAGTMFGRGAALMLAFGLLLPSHVWAQGTGAADPLAQEVLRALQQRGGGTSSDVPMQPSVQIQVPPVYPQTQPAVPFAPLRGLPPVNDNQAGLSSLERLM